jgi:hypothetical protein
MASLRTLESREDETEATATVTAMPSGTQLSLYALQNGLPFVGFGFMVMK